MKKKKHTPKKQTNEKNNYKINRIYLSQFQYYKILEKDNIL